jgi:hypothetical protein
MAKWEHLDVDKALQELDDIIKGQLQTQEKKVSAMFKKVFAVVEDFLVKNKCIVFGGYALNAILPNNEKLYSAHEIVDIDCLCVNPKELAIELADILNNLGYEFIEVKQGFFNNFKLKVEWYDILDFNACTLSTYNRLLQESHNDEQLEKRPKHKLNLAPLDFLRQQFHVEICKPIGDVSRLLKIFPRSIVFHRHFPPSSINYDSKWYSELTPDIAALRQACIDIANKQRLPIVGLESIYMLTKQLDSTLYKTYKNQSKQYSIDQHMPLVEVICTGAGNCIVEFRDYLEKYVKPKTPKQKGSSREKFKVMKFNGLHKFSILYYGSQAIVGVHTLDVCVAYNKNLSTLYGSLDATLAYLLCHLWRSDIDPNFVHKIQYMYSKISISLDKKTDNKWLNRFVLECFGEEKTFQDILSENYTQRKLLFKYNPR